MVIFPNAKINLGLRVVEKRSDGFHNLETCFIPIPYYDILEVIPASKDSLTAYNFDQEQNNILIKTRDKLRSIRHFDPVDMYLYKNIPASAGLGGGSSDAAFLLRALNNLFDLSFKDSELIEIASEIGKDCPFFLVNKSSIATGTGDVFKTVETNLSGFYIAVVTPDIGVSTKDAFSWISPAKPQQSIEQIMQDFEPAEWAGKITNDFMPVVESKYPEIKALRELIINSGAVYSSLSGTGSSVYGLFTSTPDLKGLPEQYKIWSGKL